MSEDLRPERNQTIRDHAVFRNAKTMLLHHAHNSNNSPKSNHSGPIAQLSMSLMPSHTG